MKKSIFLPILILSLTISSCRRQWTDSIMLSGHDYTFNANGDSIIITTKGASWWFAGVVLDSTHYYLQPGNSFCKQIYSDSNFEID